MNLKIYICLLQRIKGGIGGEEGKDVGVLKDEDLKLEEIESSHTLGEG
jgi:hypothetical protein